MVQEEGKKLVSRSVSWAAIQVLNTHTREERITQERNEVGEPLLRHEHMNLRSGSAVVNVL
jgi:hypothetical protein